MTNKLFLETFIATGYVSELCCGKKIVTIEKYFGSAEDISVAKKPRVYKYQEVQFAINNQILLSIKVDLRTELSNCFFDDLNFFAAKPDSYLIAYLCDKGYQYFERFDLASDEYRCIEIESSGVAVFFRNGIVDSVLSFLK